MTSTKYGPIFSLDIFLNSEPRKINVFQGYEEFDVTKQYVYIVPGLEGHHARFRLMCERFKAGALVLQPGLDFPYDTVKQTADKYAQVRLSFSITRTPELDLLGDSILIGI